MPTFANQSRRLIRVRGARANNLQAIDLDIPHGQLVVVCGRSGSGKTSLALDTLYAEGQRRYIESFSPYARQFLEQLDRPEADLLEGFPPAVAFRANRVAQSPGATVASITELDVNLALLFFKLAKPFCPQCHAPIQMDSVESVFDQVQQLPEGRRVMIAIEVKELDSNRTASWLRQNGFVRCLHNGEIQKLEAVTDWADTSRAIVDRLKTGAESNSRWLDSIESAFEMGRGILELYIESVGGEVKDEERIGIDDRPWRRRRFSRSFECDQCSHDLPQPQFDLFVSTRSPGACPTCSGRGELAYVDPAKVVPNPSLSIVQGAIAPWTTESYKQNNKDLIKVAPQLGIDVHAPFGQLPADKVELIWNGAASQKCPGVLPFVASLEKRRASISVRNFLRRWRSYRACDPCDGTRFSTASTAYQLDGKNIAEVMHSTPSELAQWLGELNLRPWERELADPILGQMDHRIEFINGIGLGYLTLDRSTSTLSTGELQRMKMTGTLGSTLVNLMYVLDEVSVGLHADDTGRMARAVTRLAKRGNTVILVEHQPDLMKCAQRIVELGPEAGNDGGRIVFDGTYRELLDTPDSLTGQYLSGRRGKREGFMRRPLNRGTIHLTGARGNNLKADSVDFPLGLLCAVTGVSGAGKSSLVRHTLYPALQMAKAQEVSSSLPFERVSGTANIDEVVLVDQTPLKRSTRSNPVTYIKAFAPIRSLLASTVEAKAGNLKPGKFSFNVAGGRCEQCKGEGRLMVDMQFMPDVSMTCDACHGRRFLPEVVRVKYRDRSVVDILNMTARQAFLFFRGHRKIQAALKPLVDVGLDYIQLGQPANTLSTGESQRLKLASYLGSRANRRALFILDEPTRGLHMSDVSRLLDCFDALINVGHSLIVIEHNLQLIAHADHVIDLGPGAAADGGRIVAQGTPEVLMESRDSKTGRYLAEYVREAP